MATFAVRNQVEVLDIASKMTLVAKKAILECEAAIEVAQRELDDVLNEQNPDRHQRNAIELLRVAQEAVTEAIGAVSVSVVCGSQRKA